MWEYQFDKLCGLWQTAVAWVIYNFWSFCCGGVKKCRTEGYDGFIVRPKEHWALVEWWRGNVEEIWMKVVPLYMNCPRIESSPSCWAATSIHITKKQNEQKLCTEHTSVLLRVWNLFLFLAFEYFFCRLYHVRVPPDNGALNEPPLAVLLGTCCVGNWPSSRNRPDWDPVVIE